MQFLLLLSALLSAVTGAFAGQRTVEAPVSRAEAQVTATARPAVRAQLTRLAPVQEAGGARAERKLFFAAPALPIAAAPLTDIRLNE